MATRCAQTRRLRAKLRALDLYAGVGGWSLGLGMAGVDVVASYEWWGEANLTNHKNNRHSVISVDVRSLNLSSLPKVDIVVGSPPCTHFSLANRGGRGNILEGLKDIEKFLEVVECLRPRFWALENVPRLAAILQSEMNQGGSLHRFAHLDPVVAVLDASEWGVPQRRKRAIIGKFDLDLLLSYRSTRRFVSLGDVLNSLASNPAVDPVYGFMLDVHPLVDHLREDFFTFEEERLNRDAKSNHPVYNGMSFPDDISRPSRTVTATCTRVSRESIVVADGQGFRRLTIRERASLQSFPINYQFYGRTYSAKQKMVGNAVPPLLTYHIAHSMLGTSPADVPPPKKAIVSFVPPTDEPNHTKPDRKKSKHQQKRKFRATVPGLRFKSGTRFELSNSFESGKAKWRFRFFFGDSKHMGEMPLDGVLLDDMKSSPDLSPSIVKATNAVVEIGGILDSCDQDLLQSSWNRSKESRVHPHALVDAVSKAVGLFIKRDGCSSAVDCVSSLMQARGNPPGVNKVIRNAREVFAGMVVCSVVNGMLEGPP